jgi:hypothetical protein
MGCGQLAVTVNGPTSKSSTTKPNAGRQTNINVATIQRVARMKIPPLCGEGACHVPVTFSDPPSGDPK